MRGPGSGRSLHSIISRSPENSEGERAGEWSALLAGYRAGTSASCDLSGVRVAAAYKRWPGATALPQPSGLPNA